MAGLDPLRSLLRFVAPDPVRAVRLFAAANIAFLGLDIVIAHYANEFANRMEWAPVIFSAVATPFLLPGAFGSHRPVLRHIERFVGLGAVLVGVIGMIFHLESGFFDEQTLRNLVYSAPFVAPLSYVGVGLLMVLVHSADATTPRFGVWVLLLALGGFVGNFALSLLDHAQNAFFRPTEWIPVAAAAYAVGFLTLAVWKASSLPASFVRVCAAVMGVEILVGIAGAALHVETNLRHSAMSAMRDRFVFGAPAFAPLLFANLALLAIIGLWACSPPATERPS